MKRIKATAHRILEHLGFIAGPQVRKRLLLANLDLNGLGLEIGPSHLPVAPKSEGFHVEILDYTDREHLIEKYRQMGVDPFRIESVDHIWDGRRYSEVVGGSERYEWIIASHVLEHVPDLLGTLKQCREILKPGGILSIALPDHRYMFDRERSPSSLAAVIDANLRSDTRPTHGTVAEFNLRFTVKGSSDSWYPWYRGALARANPVEHALARFELSRTSEEYQDIHVWVFTAETFASIIADLCKLDMLDLEAVAPPERRIKEFFMQLRRRK
jgi:SAM-dependent methyltransferase